FVAVGPVVRLRRHADVNCRPLVEPPEQLRALEGPPALLRSTPGSCIDRLGLKQPIGLLPEPDLAGVSIEPAVANDAVLFRRSSGQHRRLSRTSDRGDDFFQRDGPAGLGKSMEARSKRQKALREADDVEKEQGGHTGQTGFPAMEPVRTDRTSHSAT